MKKEYKDLDVEITGKDFTLIVCYFSLIKIYDRKTDGQLLGIKIFVVAFSAFGIAIQLLLVSLIGYPYFVF